MLFILRCKLSVSHKGQVKEQKSTIKTQRCANRSQGQNKKTPKKFIATDKKYMMCLIYWKAMINIMFKS